MLVNVKLTIINPKTFDRPSMPPRMFFVLSLDSLAAFVGITQRECKLTGYPGQQLPLHNRYKITYDADRI
jgi:hypothetical protein